MSVKGIVMPAHVLAMMLAFGCVAFAEGKTFTAGATTGFFGAESLDVALGWDGWIMSIYGISENLFRLDENYVPQPWIAERYENVDELTWQFTIREGVTFSNGNPVDAAAVKACFERTYDINDLCDPLMGIYDASQEPDPELGVACTGPFIATAFTAMTEVSLVANANYWGGVPPPAGKYDGFRTLAGAETAPLRTRYATIFILKQPLFVV